MASEEQKNDESVKGFAGLSSMVSDVDDITTSEETWNSEPPTEAASTAQTKHQPTSEPESRPDSWRQAQQPPNDSSGIFWLIAICAVIFFIWLNSESGNNSNKPTPTSYSSSSAVDSPTHSMESSKQAPTQPLIPIRPSEEKPPVGTSLNLGSAQIRYCLAEDIRLGGAKQNLNNYVGSDVDRFNVMVNDYNSRCGHFRYRNGALESAKSEVEGYRAVLETEGRARFTLPSSVGHQHILNSTPTYTPQIMVTHMLEYALYGGGLNKESEIQQIKLQIERLPKPAKGKKKAAREFNDKGLVLSKEGDFNNAVKMFEEAYELDKSDIEIVSNLGYAYLKLGDLDLAQQAITTGLTLSPGRATSWDNLADVFGIKGDISNAVACFSNTYRFSKNRLKTHQLLKKLNENEDVDNLKQARAQAIVWAEKSYPELADWKQPLPITGQTSDAKVAVKPTIPLVKTFPSAIQENMQKKAVTKEVAAEQAEAAMIAVEHDKLGTKYFYGEGVKKDLQQAIFWYQKAAEQGLANAQYNLGYMYQNGKGIQKDFQQAVLWYRKAAQQRNENAVQALKDMGVSIEVQQYNSIDGNANVTIKPTLPLAKVIPPSLQTQSPSITEKVDISLSVQKNRVNTESSGDTENFETCINGNYPSSCKHSLLTSEQSSQVDIAEKRASLR